MAQKFPPGWYPTEDGQIGLWDGKKWEGSVQPPAPLESRIGWHLVYDDVSRWWLGDHWSEARCAADGRIDVARKIGQAIVDITYLGGGDRQVLGEFTKALQEFPPCRVEQIQTYTSAVAAGTNLIAVISWSAGEATV